MFDFAWSEILLIGAVALIAIGPKDMPAAIRTVTGLIKKARRMAAEFQTHVDEMVREAELGDVKSAFNDLRRMDIPRAFERAIDPDRSIRKVFEDNPLEPNYPSPAPAPTEQEVSTLDETGAVAATDSAPTEPEAPKVPPMDPELAAAPAFIPPQFVPRSKHATAPAEPPAFIPPEVVRLRETQADS